MKKFLLFTVFATLLGLPWTVTAQDTLTVCNGTSTSYSVPVWGTNVDRQGCASEFIIPSYISGMNGLMGKNISKLTFYLYDPADSSWGDAQFYVYMAEVGDTSFNDIIGPYDNRVNIVYTGSLDATQSTMEIELDQPYFYNGDNLFIGIYVKTAANTYKSARFYGINTPTYSSCYRQNGDQYTIAERASFLPKTTFTTCGTIGSGYTCDFEGPYTESYSLPECWRRPTGTNTDYPYAQKYTDYAYNGSYALYFYGSTSRISST